MCACDIQTLLESVESTSDLSMSTEMEEAAPPVSSNHSCRSSRFSNKPSWLLLTIADLDERLKMLKLDIPEEVNADDSFAKRADAYYQQRPQLLNLLQDLYNGYLSLADRYCQALAKNQHHRRRFSSPISPLCFDEYDQFYGEDTGEVSVNDHSDAESSLSHQPATHAASVQPKPDADLIVADLVMKTADYEIIVHELNVVESRWNESSRKIELQKSLLEVLESERLILLSENATLGYRLEALKEENKGLVSETLFMKRKAAELARCVLKMREDQRVCILSQKIEDLQGQIYALEKRNKEYFLLLVKQDEEKQSMASPKSSGGGIRRRDVEHKKKNEYPGVGKKASKLWDRVKNLDVFLCGPHVTSAYC